MNTNLHFIAYLGCSFCGSASNRYGDDVCLYLVIVLGYVFSVFARIYLTTTDRAT